MSIQVERLVKSYGDHLVVNQVSFEVAEGTCFVLTFLGKANLLAAECSGDVMKLGDLRLPLGTRPASVPGTNRVQVLFRPEDVAVKVTEDALGWPLLGRGVVDAVEFSGSQERLRLRLPRLRGSRPISPPVPFGSDHMILEATRSQHLARRFPLGPGDTAWVGLRRVHALTHPGLSFLLADDGGPARSPALAYAGNLARLCHARVTVVLSGNGVPADGERSQRLREALGGGLSRLDVAPASETSVEELARQAERHPSDLMILDRPPRDPAASVRPLLSRGEHHLLLVPDAETPAPRNALVCVAGGEPGKTGVLFAGRLLRHLRAKLTLLTTLPEEAPELEGQVKRFHEAAVRSLTLLEVETASSIVRPRWSPTATWGSPSRARHSAGAWTSTPPSRTAPRTGAWPPRTPTTARKRPSACSRSLSRPGRT